MSAAYPTGPLPEPTDHPPAHKSSAGQAKSERNSTSEHRRTERSASLFSLLSRVRTRPKKESTGRTPKRSVRVFSTDDRKDHSAPKPARRRSDSEARG